MNEMKRSRLWWVTVIILLLLAVTLSSDARSAERKPAPALATVTSPAPPPPNDVSEFAAWVAQEPVLCAMLPCLKNSGAVSLGARIVTGLRKVCPIMLHSECPVH